MTTTCGCVTRRRGRRRSYCVACTCALLDPALLPSVRTPRVAVLVTAAQQPRDASPRLDARRAVAGDGRILPRCRLTSDRSRMSDLVIGRRTAIATVRRPACWKAIVNHTDVRSLGGIANQVTQFLATNK